MSKTNTFSRALDDKIHEPPPLTTKRDYDSYRSPSSSFAATASYSLLFSCNFPYNPSTLRERIIDHPFFPPATTNSVTSPFSPFSSANNVTLALSPLA